MRYSNDNTRRAVKLVTDQLTLFRTPVPSFTMDNNLMVDMEEILPWNSNQSYLGQMKMDYIFVPINSDLICPPLPKSVPFLVHRPISKHLVHHVPWVGCGCTSHHNIHHGTGDNRILKSFIQKHGQRDRDRKRQHSTWLYPPQCKQNNDLAKDSNEYKWCNQ